MTVSQTAPMQGNEALQTIVSVHSPLTQFSPDGSYYTSYAISLKSNNPCFTLSYSNLRRRYSEFLYLRKLLKLHYPTLEPPLLPPKTFFYRFNHAFIEERRKGLQKFLDNVLAIPVYLSDKSIHLFLQSSYSMPQIDQQCFGDIPVPELLDSNSSILHSDTSSTSIMNSESQKYMNLNEFPNLSCDDKEILSHDKSLMQPQTKAIPILGTNEENANNPRTTNYDVSPITSIDSGHSSLDSNHDRHVSFNDKVTVAVVDNHLWNIHVKPIKAGA